MSGINRMEVVIIQDGLSRRWRAPLTKRSICIWGPQILHSISLTGADCRVNLPRGCRRKFWRVMKRDADQKRKPIGDLFSRGGLLSVSVGGGPLRGKRGPPHCVGNCGLQRNRTQLRGHRSGLRLGRTGSIVHLVRETGCVGGALEPSGKVLYPS